MKSLAERFYYALRTPNATCFILVLAVALGFSATANAQCTAATTTTLGCVIVPTTGQLTVDGSGNISLPTSGVISLKGLSLGNGSSNGGLSVGNGSTLTLSSAPIPPDISMSQNLAGTVSGASSLINLVVSSDTADCSGGSNGVCAMLHSVYNVSGTGSGATGGRSNIYTEMIVNSGITDSAEFLGIHSQATSSTTAGGSDLQALSTAMTLKSGATGWNNVANEFDIGLQSGSSAGTKAGLEIVLSSGDAVAGTSADEGIGFTNANELTASSPGWKIGVVFGGVSNGWPINTATGTVIGTHTETAFGGSGHSGQFIPMQAMYGVNLASVNFSQDSGYSFVGPGFSVGGTGNVSIGGASLAFSPSGLTLNVPNTSVSGNPIVAAGGTDFYTGDILLGSAGGQYLVMAVSGTSVTAVSTLVPDVFTSCPSSITVTGGSGYGARLTPACTGIGDVFLGGSTALATSATRGFVHINTSAGKPTGTPANSGGAAFIYDTTDNQLCVYNGGWKCASFQ